MSCALLAILNKFPNVLICPQRNFNASKPLITYYHMYPSIHVDILHACQPESHISVI